MTLPPNGNRALRPVANLSPFDAIRRADEQGEYWLARELMPLLGYTKWERFEDAIHRAIGAIDNVVNQTGEPAAQHVSRLREAVSGGVSGTVRVDYRLTRHGAYMTVMNGDPRKPAIAAGQTYFAMKTHEAETRDLEVAAVAPVSPAPVETGDDDLAAIEHLVAVVRRERRRIAALEAVAHEHSARQDVVEARMDGIEGKHDWFSALGYARISGLSTERGYLQRLGTAAGRIARRKGIQPARTQHQLFGFVNMYPIAVLDEAAEALGAVA